MTFKVGDKVIDILLGHGEVMKSDSNNGCNGFSILVHFKIGHRDTYTEEGKNALHNLVPTLYHADDFPVLFTTKLYNIFEYGQLVVVWGDQSGAHKVIRAFSHIDIDIDDGMYCVFANGELPHGNGMLTPFPNCEAYNPDKR